MKKIFVLMVLIGVSLFILNGCTEENIVESLDGTDEQEINSEVQQSEDEIDTTTADTQNEEKDESLTTEELKELRDELMQGVNSDETTNDEEELSEGDQEIVIENFKGTPKDLTIAEETAVRWINNMANFKNIIEIRKKKDDGSYESKINIGTILEGESCEYIFNEAGIYQWYSLTKADKIKGIITVK